MADNSGMIALEEVDFGWQMRLVQRFPHSIHLAVVVDLIWGHKTAEVVVRVGGMFVDHLIRNQTWSCWLMVEKP